MHNPSAQTTRGKVLIVDDEEGIRDLCTSIVRTAGLEPYTAADGIQATELLEQLHPEFVLLDVSLPGRSGMDILREIRVRLPATQVVMVTGYASVERAVAAMKLGAHDYITKPFKASRLLQVLQDNLEARPEEPAVAPPMRGLCKLVGVSGAMQHIYELIEKAARSSSTVLIEGESGTGKELVARAIHARSDRAKAPFVPVDCGAITPSLIESELFGHVAGAYTDAKTSRPGLLRSAGTGTVFLDEIGELSAAVQVKLLRALQEMEVRPVGSSRAEGFRARIIAATNRDLSQAVARGTFRRDLFYRLHVVPIFLPPLRERREDIALLVEHFLRRYGEQSDRQIGISPGALRHLMRHDWPGNVRELENTIQRAFALLDGDVIELDDMPHLFPQRVAHRQPAETTGSRLASQEEQAIRQALDECDGNKRKAARVLGIGIATLYRKMKKYEIHSPAQRPPVPH